MERLLLQSLLTCLFVLRVILVLLFDLGIFYSHLLFCDTYRRASESLPEVDCTLVQFPLLIL